MCPLGPMMTLVKVELLMPLVRRAPNVPYVSVAHFTASQGVGEYVSRLFDITGMTVASLWPPTGY
jgi:hypothetical protein